jgi:hypothetical protein
MLIGAFVAWIWIPDVQQPSDKESKEEEQKKEFKSYRKRLLLPPRSLEDITRDPTEGQTSGLGWKMGDHVLRPFMRKSNNIEATTRSLSQQVAV